MVRSYCRYAKYLFWHKWYVLRACWAHGLYIRGIIHDWSKFRLDEFLPYAHYFYGAWKRGEHPPEIQAAFDLAWLKHQHRNAHHWQWYVLREDAGNLKTLPMKYYDMLEMLCDWTGAGRAIKGKDANVREWYEKNKEKILLHPDTREQVEWHLSPTRREI